MRSGHARCSISRLATLGFLHLALWMGFPAWGEAQGVLTRSPNLTDGWVTSTGTLQFNFNHRFWLVSTTQGDRVQNSPTFLLGAPLPGGLLVGTQYASNSRVSSDHVNEWELFLRWAPPVSLGPLRVSVTGGYNTATESADGELSVRLPFDLPESFPLDAITLLGSGRALSDAFGSGETGWFAGGGVVLHLSQNVSIAGDGGTLSIDGSEPDAVWGAALQLGIPASPHTLALVASNTRSGTLQGSSVGRRTVWGFEFTIPVSLDRYF